MKAIYIAIIGLFLIYGPHYIAKAFQEKPASEIIWELYCQDNGIDPQNPTEEQENYFLDVYCETDEYCELYEFLSK